MKKVVCELRKNKWAHFKDRRNADNGIHASIKQVYALASQASKNGAFVSKEKQLEKILQIYIDQKKISVENVKHGATCRKYER